MLKLLSICPLFSIKFESFSMQTLGFSCLFVEGASEVHPLSVAKVFCDILFCIVKYLSVALCTGRDYFVLIEPLMSHFGAGDFR